MTQNRDLADIHKKLRGRKNIAIVTAATIIGVPTIALIYTGVQSGRMVRGYMNAPTIEHTPNKGETISHWAAEEGIPNKHLRQFTEAVRYLNPQGIALHRNGPRKPMVTDDDGIYANVEYKVPDFDRNRRVGAPGNYSQQKNIGHKQKGSQYQRR